MTGLEDRAKGESAFTECWKSCSQEFAFSKEALSGALVNTFKTDNSA